MTDTPVPTIGQSLGLGIPSKPVMDLLNQAECPAVERGCDIDRNQVDKSAERRRYIITSGVGLGD